MIVAPAEDCETAARTVRGREDTNAEGEGREATEEMLEGETFVCVLKPLRRSCELPEGRIAERLPHERRGARNTSQATVAARSNTRSARASKHEDAREQVLRKARQTHSCLLTGIAFARFLPCHPFPTRMRLLRPRRLEILEAPEAREHSPGEAVT